jgi:hypothetical protein
MWSSLNCRHNVRHIRTIPFFCHQTGMVGHWILRLHTFYKSTHALFYLSFSFKSPNFILLMLSNGPPSSIVLAHRWSWNSLRWIARSVQYLFIYLSLSINFLFISINGNNWFAESMFFVGVHWMEFVYHVKFRQLQTQR